MAEQHLLLASPGQSLSRIESLSLVQIFLNASLACIAHTRELIPWMSPCLQTRYIDHIDPSLLVSDESLYTTFQAFDSKGARSGQEIRILVRGGHKRADQILEMLENGVFEALEHGYLNTLQVFVTDNNGSTPTVLETYCFTFSYDGGRVSSVEFSPTNHVFVLEHLHKSFKAAIRALLRSLKQLPRLPARRKLGMSLTYNDECPNIYQPPGFMDRDDPEEPDRLLICEALEQGVGDIVGKLDTGHYQVNVGVCQRASEDTDTPPDPQDAAMSRQLQAMQKTSSIRSTDLVSTLKDSRSDKRKNDFQVPGRKRLKVTGPSGLLSEIQVGQGKRQQQVGRIEDLETSVGELNQAGAADDPVVSEASPSRRNGPWLSISKLVELLVHCYAIQCGVSGGDGNVFDQGLLADGIIRRRNRSNRLRCECGNAVVPGQLAYCEVCGNWQHAQCYGYDETSSLDPPTERFCYTCLLFPADEGVLHLPAYIIAMRFAVSKLASQRQSGYALNEEKLQTMLQPLQCTKPVLDAVVSQLVADGVLLQEGQHLQICHLDKSNLRELERKYRHPFAHIGHLYDPDADAQDLQQRTYHIARAMEKYARGQDFTRAQGCGKITYFDQFGEPVARWGYFEVKGPSNTKPAAVNFPPATPVRRRKASISRLLVNVDRSPSVGSVSLDESSLQVVEDVTCSSDFSRVSSTATGD
ncbi:hypothetical protein A1O3_06280 [Capronia epimyces CBS 606.96]|uniref:HORMA domain-containing protein n=1 Tax=Capronia epimyces CBS 606.96 TaxID=1182542 RepID=W9XPK7_9EURO|nr:uncharacterized protein A1O3_06280 [Capronia epimyces CBS 606.96]EXJ82467.1 hypothetical protein A1O3_06280 [Capronia epimyces CBS 606.96]